MQAHGVFAVGLSLALVLIGSSAQAIGPAYYLVSQQAVPFGTPVDEVYIVDSFDVDGDGADDLALSAMIHVPNDNWDPNRPKRDFSKMPFVHSFLVQNLPTDKKFKLIDLGQDGMTQRTWAGMFFRDASQTYFALGRNGELGRPDEVTGEKASIFSITPSKSGWSLSTAFLASEHRSTASIAACDLRGDGQTALFLNNYGTVRDNAPPHNWPAYITLANGQFTEATANNVSGMVDLAAANDVRLADIDGDGRCDLLAATEVWDSNKTPPASRNAYMLINKDGSFPGPSVPLPDPPYGAEQAGFYLATTRLNGVPLVALDSSANVNGPYRGVAVQLFAYANGAFTEVTKNLLSGELPAQDTANQARLRFMDIDGDGNPDLYLSLYRGPLQVYLYRQGKFVLTSLPVPLSGHMNAVAFLRSPEHACADLAVLDSTGELKRYDCR